MKTIRFILIFTAAAFIGSGLAVLGEDKKAPDKLVFEAKTGKVTFDHTAHVKHANNDCKACHDAIFPQSKAPLNFKAAMHKTAEAAKSSCAACHVAGGKSFESKGNCAKCHVKG